MSPQLLVVANRGIIVESRLKAPRIVDVTPRPLLFNLLLAPPPIHLVRPEGVNLSIRGPRMIQRGSTCGNFRSAISEFRSGKSYLFYLFNSRDDAINPKGYAAKEIQKKPAPGPRPVCYYKRNPRPREELQWITKTFDCKDIEVSDPFLILKNLKILPTTRIVGSLLVVVDKTLHLY
jgi:hypothetical protein